jgi:hypothetical protein
MSSKVRATNSPRNDASSQPNRRWAAALTLLTILLAASSGCSSDDEDDDKAPSGGRSGSAGTGGRAGSTAAGTGGAAVEPVECGTGSCLPPMSALSGLPIQLPQAVACCVDEETAQCGSAESEGATCEPPAVADDRCPGFDLSALGNLGGAVGGGMQMTGCCTPNNQCGLDGAIFGRGCVENSAAQAQLGAIPFIGTLIMIPAARACDAPPEPTGEDAGI